MTEYDPGGAGESGDPYPIEWYGKDFNALGQELDQELARKRMFIGRMVTREYLDELGLSRAWDDESQARLCDGLNAYVISGMLMEAAQKSDATSIESTVEMFRKALPDELQNSIGLLVPLFVARGIEFQANERDSPKVQAWLEEYTLLHEATSE